MIQTRMLKGEPGLFLLPCNTVAGAAILTDMYKGELVYLGHVPV